MLDEHGQPLRPFPINLVQNYGKRVDQLVGICRGILMDGEVSMTEALAFRKVIEEFQCEEPGFPFDLLASRMKAIFAPGNSDKEEMAELKTIITEFASLSNGSSNPQSKTFTLGTPVSSRLPLDEPEPAVTIEGHQFVITGRYAYGTRRRVEEAISARGGTYHDIPTMETNYLAIGHFASRDWVHTTFGRKIEHAVAMRKQHGMPAIISEERLVKFFAD